MSHFSNPKNRTALLTLSLFALLAMALAAGFTLLDPAAQADGGKSVEQAKPAESDERKRIEEKLRLIEIEFFNYQAQVAEGTPHGRELESQVKAFIGELLARLQELRSEVANSRFSSGDDLELKREIGLLDEKFRRQERITFSNWLAKQSEPGATKAPGARGVLAPTATGAISGTVTDAATSASLENIAVQIFDSAGVFITAASTDKSGGYTTPDVLGTGTYYALTFNSRGYLDELYNNINCSSDCNPTAGTPISVTDGATTSGVNFALAAGGRISGTITDSSSSLPLVNVGLRIYDSTGVQVTDGFTDAAGNYISRSGLQTGDYFVRTANSQGYINELYDNIACVGCNPTTGTPISVTVGSTTSGKDFALTTGGLISGAITDATTSNPLGGITVQIYNASGIFVTSNLSDGAGIYTSGAGLTTGTYYALTFNGSGYINELYNNITCLTNCNITSGTGISVTTGSTTSGIDFALAAGGRISGTITDAATSAPIQSVSVRIINSSGFQVATGFTSVLGGYISAAGLPAGTYYVRTSNSLGFVDELYDNIACVSCIPTTGTPITVTAGATTSGINFALVAGGRISGTVTDAATSAPLANIDVEIYNAGGAFITRGTTNSSGIYTSETGLPGGTYYARTFNSEGYIDELYNNITCLTCNVTTGTPISVTAGATTSGINFALATGGRISGTVTDAATSAALSSVTVQVYNSSGVFLSGFVTNGAGTYTFLGLPAGTYYARTVNSLGYFDELYDNISCTSDCPITTGTPITITTGATTSGIDFALVKGGRISGIVTDAATSAPLNTVGVQIYNSSGAFVTSGATNSSGIYTSGTGLPTGTYYARTFNSQGYVDELYDNITCLNCNVTTGTPISVTAGATTSGIGFALTAGARISGTVTDAVTTAPIANVSVRIFNSSGNQVASVNTDASGNYISTGLITGTYYARTFNSLSYIDELYNNITCAPCLVTSGTPVAVTAGATTSGINFALVTGGRVSGTVTDAATSAAISNLSVSIIDLNGFGVATATTNSSGNYTISTGLPTGTYYARTANGLGYINELYNDIQCVNCNSTSGAPITVTAPSTTTGINFALTRGGRITGTVTNAATSATLQGISVQIFNAGGAQVAIAATNSAGVYTTPAGLPAGTYYARTSNFSGFVNKLYNNQTCAGCVVTSGTPISVTAGSTTTGINFALDASGFISGTVTDAATSAPLEGISVDVFNSCGQFVTSGFTDSAGNYTAPAAMPTGTYFVATSNGIGYINEVYNNIACIGCSPTSGAPVAVTAGSTTTGINFALATGSRISGTVIDAATSAPVPNVSVNIVDAAGTLITSGLSNLSGAYTTTALPPGTYYAGTSNSLGYVNEIYNGIQCLGCSSSVGTPITVTAGSDRSDIDFTLDRGGRIFGTITNAATSAPLSNTFVQTYNSAGTLVTSVTTDSSGNYITRGGLPTGTYYVRTLNSLGFVDKLYNNQTCAGCAVTSGTPISVTAGSTTSGINLALDAGGLISGTVINAATSTPLVGVTVEIYNSSGALVTTVLTDCSGNYVSPAGMPTGTYFARSVNSFGFVDKLYNNLTCVGCDPTTGTAIAVTSGQTTTSINFSLCPLSISPGSKSFEATGGEGVINVTSSGGCGWTAASSANWIEITSGASGTGNSAVSYLVRDNPSAGSRTGTITIANRTFTIQQQGQGEGGCVLSVSPTFAGFNAAGGTGNISVTTGAGCAWQASSSASWIVVTSGCCGTGNATVMYSVQPNASGVGRSGVITVAGKKFNVKQGG
jgi:hypothetical protein